jgi:hypothetical protein
MLTASMNGFYLIFCRSISHVYGACQLETHLVACSVQMSKNVMPVMRRLLGLSTYTNELRPSKFVVHVVSFYVLSGTFLAHSHMYMYSSFSYGILWSHKQRILHLIRASDISMSLITYIYYFISLQIATSKKKVGRRFFVSRCQPQSPNPVRALSGHKSVVALRRLVASIPPLIIRSRASESIGHTSTQRGRASNNTCGA